MQLFEQTGPHLENTYQGDPYLKALLSQQVPPAMFSTWQAPLERMGELSGGALYTLQQADRLNEPELTQWSPWGERIDHIALTPLWQAAEKVAAEEGLVALPYEKQYGAFSRVLQFALVYLFTPSSDIYSCPLAMTDGAATTLLQSGNQPLVDRALPHLTSRDPAQFWTSGQWMTELPGGSDVSRTETTARPTETGWQLQGRKWFTSATTSQMALALARPEGNPDGSKGLALFYLEPRDAQGKLQNIQVNRLKDKMGTRKVPTAELLLTGTPAQLVAGTTHGVKQITPMLNITRTWNAVSAIGLMRRGLHLAWDYATRRRAFGDVLIRKPLHRETLVNLEATFARAFCFTFACVQMLGKQENGAATPQEQEQLRLFVPLLKLSTGKQAVQVLSEVMESFGGAGYVEDTGIPQLLRDAQVLPIWEGTTNVLSLDSLHVLLKSGKGQLEDWLSTEHLHATGEAHEGGRQCIAQVLQRIQALKDQPEYLESQARTLAWDFALGLGQLYLADFAVACPELVFAANTDTPLTVTTAELLRRSA